MEGLAVVFEAMLAGRGIDGHAADGIEHLGRRVMVMACGIMAAAAGRFFCGAALVGARGLGHHNLRRLKHIPYGGI